MRDMFIKVLLMSAFVMPFAQLEAVTLKNRGDLVGYFENLKRSDFVDDDGFLNFEKMKSDLKQEIKSGNIKFYSLLASWIALDIGRDAFRSAMQKSHLSLGVKIGIACMRLASFGIFAGFMYVWGFDRAANDNVGIYIERFNLCHPKFPIEKSFDDNGKVVFSIENLKK